MNARQKQQDYSFVKKGEFRSVYYSGVTRQGTPESGVVSGIVRTATLARIHIEYNNTDGVRCIKKFNWGVVTEIC